MATDSLMLAALFEWLNSLREEAKIRSLDNMSSGLYLWKLLREVDAEAFTDDLPCMVAAEAPPAAWTDKLNNLKHIHEALSIYIRDRCRRKLPLPDGEPDLAAVAKVESEKDAIQLLKLVFLAVIFGRFSMDYIQELTTFSPEHQTQFYLILEETETLEVANPSPPQPGRAHSDQGDAEDASSSVDGDGEDDELIYEERLAELVAVKKGLQTETFELKEQLENLHDQHTKLQKSYDNLEVSHKDTSERLDALRSGKGEQSMLNIQRAKMQQQETVIATFESKMAVIQQERDRFKTETEALGSQLEDFHQMQDQVFELKHEREQLERRANTADKYKQKVSILQKTDDENEALKYRVSEMQRQLKESDSDHFSNSDLQRENDEYRRLVSNIEQELSDSIKAKKRAEFEKMTLEAKMQLADGQASKWQARAESLQQRLLERSGPDSPSTPRGPTGQSPHLTDTESDPPQSDDDAGRRVSEAEVEEPNVITEQELQSIISAMKAHNRGMRSEPTTSIQEQQKQAMKLEHLAADSKDVKKQLTDRSALVASLRAELDLTTNGGPIAVHDHLPTATPQPQQRPDTPPHDRLEAALLHNANLERELQLIASAWYDQNTRLMTSTAGGFISRGRARPEPKSFLARQRRLVDGLLTGRS